MGPGRRSRRPELLCPPRDLLEPERQLAGVVRVEEDSPIRAVVDDEVDVTACDEHFPLATHVDGEVLVVELEGGRIVAVQPLTQIVVLIVPCVTFE